MRIRPRDREMEIEANRRNAYRTKAERAEQQMRSLRVREPAKNAPCRECGAPWMGLGYNHRNGCQGS